jgi:glycosyltransferase involved in cell wall biosynthesis
MTRITTIIITLNEERNIRYAIESVRGWTDILIVDSGSTDRTIEIAESMGAKVLHHCFEDYASQRNWALVNDPFSSEWILFLDADEVISIELREEIIKTIANTDCDGFYLKRQFFFMGRWIKHGGEYPAWFLRLFKKGKGVFERSVNEHMKLIGKVGYLANDFADINRNGVGAWVSKHNRYANMEAQELMRFKKRKGRKQKDAMARLFGSQAERKRWIREHIWNSLLPPLIRPLFYFVYCYVIRRGFLDGKAGFIYRVLHGLWYKFLIDVKYIELLSTGLNCDSTRNSSGSGEIPKTQNSSVAGTNPIAS